MFECFSNKKILSKIKEMGYEISKSRERIKYISSLQTGIITRLRNIEVVLEKKNEEIAEIQERLKEATVPAKPGKKIFVEAGHGFSVKRGEVVYDPGARGQNLDEHVVASEIVAKAAHILEERGYSVTLKKYSDASEALTLAERGRQAYGHDAALSVHLNAFDKQAEHTLALVATDHHGQADLEFASILCDKTATAIGNHNAGVKTDWGNYTVPKNFHEVGVPGCLLECFFIDSPGELSEGKYDQTVSKTARAIADAFEEFLRYK
jgi:N-acetylmuramoyl-L-alanine amidase